MSRSKFAGVLSEILNSEDAKQRFQDMFNEVTARRVMTVGWRYDASQNKKVPIEEPVYPIKEATAFLRLLADFGVGKPAEQKEVRVGVGKLEDLEALSDAELIELASYRELPELPPAA